LLLWDIDGTLIRGGPLGRAVFDQAIETVVGRAPEAEIVMSGKTDPAIVAEHLGNMDIVAEPELVAAVLRSLEEHLGDRADELAAQGTVCAGIEALLARLSADERLINGVVTGNIVPNARVKLAAFGLDRWLDFDCSAYGSDNADRNALVPVAMARVAARHGADLEPDSVWVIGDTPRDLACARAAGVHCLLVGTGRIPVTELGTLGADVVLADLSDTEAVTKLLTAGL
jgi:phosphoglycolate phosphatase-like HAD superfamily hydrolase